MRYRHKSSQHLAPATPESAFLKKQTAAWLLRLLQYELPVDDNFFNLIGWILNTPEELAARLIADIKLPSETRRKEKSALKDLRGLANARSQRLTDELETLFDDHSCLRPHIMQVIEDILHSALKSTETVVNPVAGLKRLFRLNDAALQICLYAFGIENFRVMEWYLEDQLEIGSFNAHRIFSSMLNIAPDTLREELASLRRLGILGEDPHLRLSDKLDNACLNAETKRPINLFCRPVPRTSLPLDMFRIPDEEKNHVLGLLGTGGSDPVHILLYGVPGSGKTSFAASLIKALGARAWSVTNLVDDNERDRRVSLCATLALAERHEGSIVVVDEAERMLDTDWERRESSAKAWLNDLLERRGLRIIWITNHVQHLDHAVRRRFTYSIHFAEPGIAEAEQMWTLVARREKVLKKFPADTVHHLASTYPVPVATMQMAIRQAKSAAAPEDFLPCVERVLRAQVVLRNDGEPMRKKRTAPANYDPAAICTTLPVDDIVRKIKNLSTQTGQLPECMGNMLFYGPPGTGKTAFGRYLADRLGLECRFVRASDLLNMYVGGTEQLIRRAFETAEKNRELLLIDEADSFVSARKGAAHSWEVSMVNEFLTCLETFRGICVCTTNFRQLLDEASMRRFPQKVEFAYAGPGQIRALYSGILAPLAQEPVDDALIVELTRQKRLAPGDFLAVRGQFFLADPQDVRHEDMIRALLREQKLKLEEKNIGF